MALETYNAVIPIYIGWDTREEAAYAVAVRSLIRHATCQLHIRRLDDRPLRFNKIYTRDWHSDGNQKFDNLDGKPFSTEFSFARFLVPAMEMYQGWAMFVDCDFLFRADIAQLFSLRDPKYAVQVVKHRHVPDNTEKMDGQIQSKYHRKNWSSMILWNCAHPSNKFLTVEQVNNRPGQWLHSFAWLQDRDIGELPVEWNWLVGHSDQSVDPKAVHFTDGGPWFDEYRDVPYASEWLDVLAEGRAEPGLIL